MEELRSEEKGTPTAIRAAGRELVHAHISESDRGTAGARQMDCASIIQALRDSGCAGDLAVEALGQSAQECARSCSCDAALARHQSDPHLRPHA